MPKFTEQQIKEGIGDGSISAISVDTAVFDAYGCRLDHAVLARLDQFKKGGVKLLLSEIVAQEITAHIARDAAETQRTLKTALKHHIRRWKLDENLDQLTTTLNLDVEAIDVAREQVEVYLESIGAQIVPASGRGDLAAEVLRRYFEILTPFEAREGKKHEFPDAFALLSLEQVAAERHTLIVCVSPDKSWAVFAEQSDHLVVVPKLDVALSWFNDPGRNVAEKVVAMWKANAAPDLIAVVESAFEYYLDGLLFDVEGHAPLEYEYEPLSAVVQYIDVDKLEPPVVIAEDADQVTFTVKVIAKVGFEAEFNFYAHDSIDGDNVGLGSQSSYQEEDVPFEITISVAREMVGDQFDVLDVSVTSRRIVVDFGYVDPFPGEDPTHEKY
ncbi:PIN domain-containing protein [Mesorhizobium ciceri]|uniref:PIN domain-containing protein n=1 Tax=Mesorhizobium TaxID=68287 RepID=UPI000478C370|nr:PIN domain-containing protein [Mesorhizobium ciceri]